MKWRGFGCCILLGTGLLWWAQSVSHAEEAGGASATPPVETIIRDYCGLVADQASERRQALLKRSLSELETRVEDRLDELEKAKAELEVLIKRREDLRNLARKELVDIYAGMEPSIAAAQMEQVDVQLASSIIRQLKPRLASAILDETKPEFAARIVRLIASPPPEQRASN